MDRREFLACSAAAAVPLALPGAVAAPGLELRHGNREPSPVPTAAEYAEAHRFTRQLRRPRRIDLTRRRRAVVDIVEFHDQVLDRAYPATRVWGYRAGWYWPSSPGPTILTRSNHPVDILWRNRLPRNVGTSLLDSHLLPVDPQGHLPSAHGQVPRGIPSVTHLHGAHVAAEFDGGPDAWATQYDERGSDHQQGYYRYENTQGTGTLWYHDHAVGITRLNVFAGLAGMYLVRDDNELRMMRNGALPCGDQEVELVIQDKNYDVDGNLDLPTGATGRLPSSFTQFILVNGAKWPVLDVEPKPYRFRILNASDSRFYILKIRETSQASPENDLFLQVGTDLGFRAAALPLNQIIMAPAERYDIVIDFSDFAGKELILENHGVDGPMRGFTSALPLDPRTASNDPSLPPYTFGNPFAPAPWPTRPPPGR